MKINPKQSPGKVWEKYGFPLISKETAEAIHNIKTNPDSATSKHRLDPNNRFRLPLKWRFLLDEDFDISKACCQKLKKEPVHRIAKQLSLSPIIGTLAEESSVRTEAYIRRGGCNTFGENATSLPLSIWTESDIWDYIRKYNVEIADIYSKGMQRTGCAACGFGCHFKGDNRLQLLYELYPKYYNLVMNFTNHGVTYREALRKILKVNNLYLPDERPNDLFD